MSSLFHPLCGSNLSTLLRLFLTNGGINRPNLAPATLALAVTLARLPFSTLERILMTGFYERGVQVKAPIFIVGYWRSGLYFAPSGGITLGYPRHRPLISTAARIGPT